jgi:hypothetical protein
LNDTEVNSVAFVLPNGTVLFALTQNTWVEGNLSWQVISRAGNVVTLNLTYSIRGVENAPPKYSSDYNLVFLQHHVLRFDFNTSVVAEVDLQDNVARVGGKPAGVVNFWSSPLPKNKDTLPAGTAFVGNMSYVVNASAHVAKNTFFPVVTPKVMGKAYSGVVSEFTLFQQDFVEPPTSRNAWLNTTSEGVSHTTLPPFGYYDYYTGLALAFSVPSYPVQMSVCRFAHNATYDCGYVPYATSLGEYFRSELGSLYLVSTNVQVGPPATSQPPSQTPFGEDLLTLAGISTCVVAGAMYWMRRRSRAKDAASVDVDGSNLPASASVNTMVLPPYASAGRCA